MNLENRFQNQIRNTLSVFENVLPIFNRHQPVDAWLSNYFRSHRQIGSKDRKRISNSIFGYFRWYGWIRKLSDDDRSLALLLGYLLDDNNIDDSVAYWLSQFEDSLDKLSGASLALKREIISEKLGEVSISELNPPLVKNWSDELIASFQTRPALWVRLVNETETEFFQFLGEKNVAYEIHPQQPRCLKIKSPINLFEFAGYRMGKLEVQDISSQGVGLLSTPEPDETWWDVCAGAGGKALHLLSLMNDTGRVYATEVNKSRFNVLKKRLSRYEKSGLIETIFWNGTELPEFAIPPKNILIDAPCSCSGTWRRSPDLRWSIDDDGIQHYSNLQLSILSLSCPVVPDGGKLVYATCSVFEQENELVINRFLEQHPEFELQTVTCPFTGNKATGGIHLQPPEIDGNSMFVAVLLKS